MFQYIDSLRSKPEKTRRKYALGISAVIVAVIAIIRIITFSGLFDHAGKSDAIPTPIDSLVQNMSGGLSHIKGAFSNIKIPNFSGSQSAAVSDTASSTIATSTATTTPKDPYNEVIFSEP